MQFQLGASCVNFGGAASAAQQNGHRAQVTSAFKGQNPVQTAPLPPHPPPALLPSNKRWMSHFHYVPPPIDGHLSAHIYVLPLADLTTKDERIDSFI